jgi:ferrous iron transport protein B
MNHQVTIGVIGNPNCGKTTLFNVLTGTKQRVGNWPGVTVERKVGSYQHADYNIELVDLPGIYSLDLTTDVTSLDEQITQDYILSGEPQVIINIVDGANLERNLYLTAQLLEMGVPMVVAINMMDIAKQRQINIAVVELAQQLGVPVVPLVAAKKVGIAELKTVINHVAKERPLPPLQVNYPDMIEAAITKLLPLTEHLLPANKTAPARWIILKLLENDSSITPLVGGSLNEMVAQHRHTIEAKLQEDVDILVADSRYAFISSIIEQTVTKSGKMTRTRSDQIDKIVLNRVVGIPIFLAVMYLMFMFTINLGGAFIDFFDILVKTTLVEGFGEILRLMSLPEALITLLAGGIGGGIQVVATFIPVIGFLFLFLSFLEDSGYMARAAFVMDRFMRFIGLPGKSFVPLIVGFGCNVPAVMATRTLEKPRDRLLTILMTPFMSCGARLPVYALFAVAFFPVGGQNIVFGLYLIGIAVAILTGLIMKNTLLRGEVSDFFMELPPYHLPTLQNVFLHTWERLKSFIFTAGKVIVPMVILLTFLNAWGTDGSFGNENSQKSVLSEMGRTLTPVFQPMGLKADNWPATVGIFTGILAKEAVVGTLNSLYTQMAGTPNQPGDFHFWRGLKEAWATIPTHLTEVTSKFLDPLGLNLGDTSNQQVAATKQAVNAGTFGVMAAKFDGQIGAFAFLLFILLYFPCAATMAAIYQETNLRWTILVASWTTGLAYLFATLFYQLATFGRHPLQSLVWTTGLLSLFGLMIMVMYSYSRRQAEYGIYSVPLLGKTE